MNYTDTTVSIDRKVTGEDIIKAEAELKRLDNAGKRLQADIQLDIIKNLKRRFKKGK